MLQEWAGLLQCDRPHPPLRRLHSKNLGWLGPIDAPKRATLPRLVPESLVLEAVEPEDSGPQARQPPPQQEAGRATSPP